MVGEHPTSSWRCLDEYSPWNKQQKLLKIEGWVPWHVLFGSFRPIFRGEIVVSFRVSRVSPPVRGFEWSDCLKAKGKEGGGEFHPIFWPIFDFNIHWSTDMNRFLLFLFLLFLLGGFLLEHFLSVCAVKNQLTHCKEIPTCQQSDAIGYKCYSTRWWIQFFVFVHPARQDKSNLIGTYVSFLCGKKKHQLQFYLSIRRRWLLGWVSWVFLVVIKKTLVEISRKVGSYQL